MCLEESNSTETSSEKVSESREKRCVQSNDWCECCKDKDAHPPSDDKKKVKMHTEPNTVFPKPKQMAQKIEFMKQHKAAQLW